MAESENKIKREEIFSETVRAGKRTYFFDVKATKSNEYYLTITESKRRFNNEQGKFYYEKHKLFLYKEDFEKFQNGLKTVIDFIESGVVPEVVEEEATESEVAVSENIETNAHTDIEFEDLGKEEKIVEETVEEENSSEEKAD